MGASPGAPGSQLVGRALLALPAALRGALLPGRPRLGAADVPAPTPAPPGEVRLYVAPANSAGQGHLWARAAARELDGVGAASMSIRRGAGYEFPADTIVDSRVVTWSTAWQRAQRRAVETGFTHVLAESQRRLFGGPYSPDPLEEISALRAAGLGVALLCHGSDVRLPSRHAAAERDSPFQPGVLAATPELERQAARAHRIIAEAGVPVFVSTLGTLADVPHATWLPVVVDVDRWGAAAETAPPPLAADRLPVVVHAPSSSAMKGSDLVDPDLEALDAEGVATYRRLRDVPAAEMPAAFAGADIVLDQFRLGDYGVAAVEAMAAGRVVVAHVNDDVRRGIRERTGLELPIVEARGAEAAAAVRELVADPARAAAVGEAGAEFARAVHDGRRSAAALAGFLGRPA
ncbi:MAG: glycosyltransferase [Microbacteriaceae bacterium]